MCVIVLLSFSLKEVNTYVTLKTGYVDMFLMFDIIH